jgi:hypothetical protein
VDSSADETLCYFHSRLRDKTLERVEVPTRSQWEPKPEPKPKPRRAPRVVRRVRQSVENRKVESLPLPLPEQHRPSGRRTVNDDVLCTCHAVMIRLRNGAYVCHKGGAQCARISSERTRKRWRERESAEGTASLPPRRAGPRAATTLRHRWVRPTAGARGTPHRRKDLS